MYEMVDEDLQVIAMVEEGQARRMEAHCNATIARKKAQRIARLRRIEERHNVYTIAMYCFTAIVALGLDIAGLVSPIVSVPVAVANIVCAFVSAWKNFFSK